MVLSGWRGDRGAVIMEAVIAAFILALAVVPIFYDLGGVLTSVDEARVAAVAVSLAQDRVEYLKALGGDALPLGSTVLRNYDPSRDGSGVSAFDLVETVAPVETMADLGGAAAVKMVVISVHRHPLETNPAAVTWEFLIYADGS